MSETHDLMNPSASLLVKLGSAVVHAEEFFSANGNPVDKVAFESAMKDSELQAWIKGMTEMGMLPVKR